MTRNLLPLAAFALISASFPLPAQRSPTAGDTAYADGTRAMNEHRWADAVACFDRVVDSRVKRSDAALYWKAYSLDKLGSGPLAVATCNQLHSFFNGSSWNRDCDALTLNLRTDVHVQIPPVPVMPPMPPMGAIPMYRDRENDPAPGSNADLKILALNSLLHRDPAQAIPLLRGILTGNQPENVKKHAIFVLAQSKSPEAQGTLHDLVMGKMGEDLQRQAIQMTAVFQGKRANDSLAEVYRATSDPQIKRSIISAFFISQDAPRMVELARNEKNLELKRTIVSQLALMPDKAATEYMLELLK